MFDEPGAYWFMQGALQIPVLVVLVVGGILVAARRDRLSPLARRLAVAGCGVLLIDVLVGVAWLASMPMLLNGDRSAAEFGMISAGVGLVLNICQAVGLGLLVGGVLAGGIQHRSGPVNLS